jgi:hypothetical protein
MNKNWQAAIAAAEVDQADTDRHMQTCQGLLALSKRHVSFYANLVDYDRVNVTQFKRLIGEAYLRLMNSGISHRAFLAFVKQQEALK